MAQANAFRPATPPHEEFFISTQEFERFEHSIRQRGLATILTGPRGVGKTTWAYVALERIQRKDINARVIKTTATARRDPAALIHSIVVQLVGTTESYSRKSANLSEEIRNLRGALDHAQAKDNEVYIFIDDLDILPNPEEFLHLIPLMHERLHWIFGATNVAWLHKISNYVRNRITTVSVPGFSFHEIYRFFDQAEAILKKQGTPVRFDRYFRDAAASDSKGSPRLLQAIGFEAISAIQPLEKGQLKPLGKEEYLRVFERIGFKASPPAIVSPGPNRYSEDAISVFIDPGDASSEDIEEFFAALANLHRACGGFGITLRDGESKVFIPNQSFA